MAERKVKIILSGIMLFSLIIVVLSLSGVIAPGQQISDPTNESNESGKTSSETKDEVNGNSQETIMETTLLPTFLDLIPLPIDLTEPGTEPAYGLRRWPEKTSIEILRQPDLDKYQSRSRDQQPLEGITIFLDPGHGGQDGGTQYPHDSTPIVIEKEINLPVAIATKEKLENLGARVIMTRETDVWMSLYSRAALVGREILLDFQKELPVYGYEPSSLNPVLEHLDKMLQINSDAANSGGRGIMQGPGASSDVRLIYDIQHQYPDALFISIHCNAYADSSQVRGLQVYYLTGDTLYEKENANVAWQESSQNEPAYTLYDDEGRLHLATLVKDEILDQLPELQFTGQNDILEDNYAVLRQINLPGILLEMGFITNENDRRLLQDPTAQGKIADGIANAVFAYYCRP